MTTLLVDTSVWVEYLRGTGSRACEELASLLVDPGHRIVTTPPVVMELLAGAASEQALLALEQLTAGMPTLALDPAADFHAAAAAYRAARARGLQVRGLVDCLLTAVADRHGATLVHRDADIARLQTCLPRLRTSDLR